ncbi:hypothetical protein BJ878DRAFT_11396 [Calycina marina]|uniref:Uncharacterized protein n=1 Tax=Calycina marina TaxID=1763456 RepID=A0A9P7Z5L1_9HELO|nr:hypothetical protein BJ878DRAFT_11396 [Calycina marina]
MIWFPHSFRHNVIMTNLCQSNAVLWMKEGWDGNESMIAKSSAHCLRQPSKIHIIFISGTAAKTVVIWLHVISAINALIMGIVRPTSYKYADLVSISYVFVPMTISGIFRLPIAFCLSDNYSFANFNKLDGAVSLSERPS